MPAYNHERYIGAAVESVLGQTYGDFELIVVDDASTDATWSVLRSFKDARLVLSRHDVNQGAHATLNEASRRAQGEFIAVINSDDVYYPGRLEKAVNRLGANLDLGACFTRYDFISESGETISGADALATTFPDAERYLGPESETVTRNELQVLSLLARNYLHTTSNLVCRRQAAERIGAFRNFRYVHDHEFFLRLCFHYPIEVLPECLLGYRFHTRNTLAEDAVASVSETAAMLSEFLLTHELMAMQPGHPAAALVFKYLLENFNTYGADRLMLMYVLAGVSTCQRRGMKTPIFRDWAADELVQRQVCEMLKLERAFADLHWQEDQTKKWWRIAQKRSTQLAHRKTRQDRLGKDLWDLRQALWETQQNLRNTERRLDWWRDKYNRTFVARIRRVLGRVLGSVSYGAKGDTQ